MSRATITDLVNMGLPADAIAGTPARVVGSVALSTLTYGAGGTLDAKTLVVSLEGSSFTVTFGTGAAAPANKEAVVDAINATPGLAGVASLDSTARLRLTSQRADYTSAVIAVSGTGLTALGFTAAQTSTSTLPAIYQACLDGASARCDDSFAKRFVLPLSAFGKSVVRAEVFIAAFDFVCRRGFNPESGPDKMVKERRDEALKWLDDVAAGRLEPVGVVDSSPSTEEAAPLVESEASLGWMWPSQAVDE